MLSNPLKSTCTGPLEGSRKNKSQRAGALWLEAQRLRILGLFRRFDSAYMPFSQFENCNVGNLKSQKEAYERNQKIKGLILPYIAAWMLRGVAMGASLFTAKNVQALGVDTVMLQAAFAISFTMCIMFCLVMFIGWLGLTLFRQ